MIFGEVKVKDGSAPPRPLGVGSRLGGTSCVAPRVSVRATTKKTVAGSPVSSRSREPGVGNKTVNARQRGIVRFVRCLSLISCLEPIPIDRFDGTMRSSHRPQKGCDRGTGDARGSLAGLGSVVGVDAAASAQAAAAPQGRSSA